MYRPARKKYNAPKDDNGGVCVAGSISQLPNGKFYVSWYDKKLRKNWKIYKYKGLPLYNREMAEKLLHTMQGDVENGCFRVEKYTIGETDVVPYLREWVEAVAPTISLGTYANYKNSINKHLTPFYRSKPLSLNEIAYDNLVQLMNSISREGAGKQSVMKCLHRCLRYAKKSGRIQTMPEFPERSMYQIVERPIRWLSSADQRKVIEAIPLDHQPIFWWLKWHLRRPGEAMALRKEDHQDGVFTVCRGISAKREVSRTKTGEVHNVPMVSEFSYWQNVEMGKQRSHSMVTPYLFANPGGRTAGHRYTSPFLNALWHAACQSVGVDIDLYSGLKHSTASQMINEDGYSISQVQMAGDWSSVSVVKKYAKTETGRVKALLERGKVMPLRSRLKQAVRDKVTY